MKSTVLFLLAFLPFFTHPAFAAPTVYGVSPSSGFQGATLNLTISGDGFVPGGTELHFSGAGVIVNGVRVVSATSIVANITLLADPGVQAMSVLSGGTSGAVPFQIFSSPLSNPENAVVNHFSGSSSFFGTRDGRGPEARFHGPAGIWSDGTSLYVVDDVAQTIRKILIDTADVTTLAGTPYQPGSIDGIGSNAHFSAPTSIWGDGTSLYTNEACTIRKTVIATGEVTTFAGVSTDCKLVDGPPEVARLRDNSDFIWGDGAFLYVFNPPICQAPTPGSCVTFLPGAIRVVSLTTREVSSMPLPRGEGGTFGLVAMWGLDGYLYTFWASPPGSLAIGRFNTTTHQHEFLFNSQGTCCVPTFVPRGPWFDGKGNFYFLEDRTVRRLVLATGELSSVTTLPATASNKPMGLWGVGDDLYVTDEGASIVSRVHIPTQTASVVAGQAAPRGPDPSVSPFESTRGMWGDGRDLYIISYRYPNDHGISHVDLATNSVTLPGESLGPLRNIWGDGTYLYVTDPLHRVVFRLSRSTGEQTTLAAGLTFPDGIWGDSTYLYVTDGMVVRRVTKATGAVMTVAGADGQRGAVDGTGDLARFDSPSGIWGDGVYLYVADYGNATIRRIRISTAEVMTFAGSAGQRGGQDGIGPAARFSNPTGMSGDGTNLYVADILSTYTVRKIAISSGAVTTLATTNAIGLWADGQFLYTTTGSVLNRITIAEGDLSRVIPPLEFSDGVIPSDRFNVATSWNDGEFLYGTSGNAIYKVRIANGEITHIAGAFAEAGFADGVGNHARFTRLTGMWGDGTYLYVLQGEAKPGIRRINIGTREVSTLAAFGPPLAGAITFKDIWGSGPYLYVTDILTRSIHRVSIAGGEVTRFAGGDFTSGPFESVDATGTEARFLSPGAIWGDGSNLYVSDGCTIRKIIIATVEVTTFAGVRDSCADIDGPRGTGLLGATRDIWGTGRFLFVSGPHVIRTVDLASGEVKTIAGNPVIIGTEDGSAFDARFWVPEGITSDGVSLYVYDVGSIRKFSFAAATAQYSLLASGGARWTTSIPGSMATGYARLQAAAGSTTADGVAIYSYRTNGVLVSEASVAASRLIQEGRIYAETGGAVNTGIAIANPNDQGAVISFYFTDAVGVSSGNGNMTIPPNSQIAAFLNAAPYAGTANARSFTFTSSLPVGAVALRGYVNERSEFLMTTLPVAPISSSSTDTIFLPQFADGGGWQTQVLLVNPTDEALSGTVEIDAVYDYSIAPRSSARIVTPGADVAVHVGSARVSSTAGTKAPVASVVFSYVERGVTVTENGAPSAGVATSFRVFAEYGAALRTGIAVANTASTAADVQFELLDLTGQPAGHSGSIALAANGHCSLFIDEIPGFQNLPSSFRGVLLVSSNTAISVLGLRGRYNERGEFLISTTPALAENAAPTAAELLFPHFVTGGGYTTEFLLMSRGTGSQGSVSFVSQSGAELSLPIEQ